MKKSILFFSVFLFFGMLLTSCKKNDEPKEDDGGKSKSELIVGTWERTYKEDGFTNIENIVFEKDNSYTNTIRYEGYDEPYMTQKCIWNIAKDNLILTIKNTTIVMTYPIKQVDGKTLIIEEWDFDYNECTFTKVK